MEGTRTIEISEDVFLGNAFSFFTENDFSFAVWRLPSSGVIHIAASEHLKELTEISLEDSTPGFLFAPFDPQQKKIFLPADESYKFESGKLTYSKGKVFDAILSQNNTQKKFNRYTVPSRSVITDTDEHAYMALVVQCKDEIARGRFEKIVPSRTKNISLPPDFELLAAFNRLCDLYPQALISIFSSPLTGTWVGATPELLVSINREQHFRTTAIAGTLPYQEGTDLKSVSWTQKDIEEQALVERYIISCFKKIRLREFEEHGPKTVVAGNLLHLKTDFDVDMTATNFPQLGSIMLKLLHPTSAVCGMPLESSFEFLRTHEGYDRQYYSGYLGPVNMEQESHVYVNLRCMQLLPEGARLYAGAGVLADSDPDKEWRETDLKMNTLLRVIRQ